MNNFNEIVAAEGKAYPQLKDYIDKLKQFKLNSLNSKAYEDMHSAPLLISYIKNGITNDFEQLSSEGPDYTALQGKSKISIPEEHVAMKLTLAKFIEKGVIEECTHTPKAVGTTFLVPKPDGTYWIVFNGKKANAVTLNKSKFTLPTIADALSSDHSWFAKLDLRDAFLHFKLEDKIKDYFAFNYDGKIYRYNVLPFGWSNSPRFC